MDTDAIFQWAKVKHENDNITLSLLKIVDGRAQFLASIDVDSVPYKFAAYNKDGILASINDYNFYNLEELQSQIEKFLLDEGILQYGNVVEYLDEI